MTRLIEANFSAPFPAVDVASPELVLGRDSLGRSPIVNMDGPTGSGRENAAMVTMVTTMPDHRRC